MAEIVRFKKRDVGEFYISILDYDTVNKTWQTWSGIVYTSKVMTKTGIGRLTKTYVPPDNNIPKTPSPPEPAAGPVPAATATPPPVRPDHPSKVFAPQDLEPCIFCKVLVKHKNMKRHVHRTHPALAQPVRLIVSTPQPVRPDHPSKVFPPQDLEPCIFCKVLVKHKNMKRHVHRTHPTLAEPVRLIVYPKISS